MPTRMHAPGAAERHGQLPWLVRGGGMSAHPKRLARLSIALALVVAVPAAAADPHARQVDTAYEVSIAGIDGIRTDLRARFDGARYLLESHTFKIGLLRAFTAHYEGHNRAWGRFTPEGARPAGGSLSVVGGGKPRTWMVRYAPDGTVAETHQPERKPAPRHVIPEDAKRGAFDPLSHAIVVSLKGDALCAQSIRSYDGKQRVDVVLRKIAIESAAKAGVPGAKGDVLVCEALTTRIAGEFNDAQQDDAQRQRERPVKLWLARLDDTPMRYPVKFEAQSAFGTVRGRMLHFRERPLTESERLAMTP